VDVEIVSPLSETISSVSARPWARAGEKIAGADTVPAASAVMDLRSSRRFMPSPRSVLIGAFAGDSAKLMPTGPSAKALKMRRVLTSARNGRRLRFAQLHTNARFVPKL
jgi:hypothetical protein